MTNEIVSELRILHEEICTSDGGECEMMALVRRGADEIERLRKELDAVTKDRDDLQEKYNESVLSR